MKRGFLGSVLAVSLLGAVACGDDAHHDSNSDPIDESDSDSGSRDGVEYSADGSVIHTGGGSAIDGGVEGPGHTPSSSDAGDEGEEQTDGGRRGRNPRPTFDAGFTNPFERDGGPRVGPGPVRIPDGGFRIPVPVERDAGEREPVEGRDGGRRPRP